MISAQSRAILVDLIGIEVHYLERRIASCKADRKLVNAVSLVHYQNRLAQIQTALTELQLEAAASSAPIALARHR